MNSLQSSVLVRCALPATFAFLLLSSCSSTDRGTQITLALESETRIPDELDSFAIRVFSNRNAELRFARDYFPTNGREFPTTLALVPSSEDALESPLRIEIEARKGGSVLLRRQAVMSYFRNRNVLLTMPLRMACFQFRDCAANETCAGGQCVAAEVDSARLVDYDAALVFPKGGACFDEDACIDATEGKLELAEDCTFAIPSGVAVDRGNVSIRWRAAPLRLLALQSGDALEGWERIDAGLGRLSQGVCDSHFQRKDSQGNLLVADVAEDIYFSSKCDSKSGRTPYCVAESNGHSGTGVDQAP